MKIVVLGDGLLGSEIIKQTGWDYISRKKDGFDITEPEKYKYFFQEILEGVIVVTKYDVVVNCIANTDTYSEDSKTISNVNYQGPIELVKYLDSNNIKLVQISSDYVYSQSSPCASERFLFLLRGLTFHPYIKYKILLDEFLSRYFPNTLICRCSFKPNPFPYDQAWDDLIGNFDYVDVIAGLIIKLINKDAEGIYNVGTEVKSIYDLAKRTKPEVQPIPSPSYAPKDVTMNLTKMENFLK